MRGILVTKVRIKKTGKISLLIKNFKEYFQMSQVSVQNTDILEKIFFFQNVSHAAKILQKNLNLVCNFIFGMCNGVPAVYNYCYSEAHTCL